jgi:putative membrane protein
MIVLSAFLHHLAAFTLVATLAIEFVLIRQELTLANARRLSITDIIFGRVGAGSFIGNRRGSSSFCCLPP